MAIEPTAKLTNMLTSQPNIDLRDFDSKYKYHFSVGRQTSGQTHTTFSNVIVYSCDRKENIEAFAFAFAFASFSEVA